MGEKRLGNIESKFAYIIWANEPISSGELVKIAEKTLNWKKSTTYTVLKKLCDRGIFQNDKSVVSSIISKEDFYAMQTEEFVNETFNGSLPAFLAAFTKRKKLTRSEAQEVKELIENFEEDK